MKKRWKKRGTVGVMWFRLKGAAWTKRKNTLERQMCGWRIDDHDDDGNIWLDSSGDGDLFDEAVIPRVEDIKPRRERWSERIQKK